MTDTGTGRAGRLTPADLFARAYALMAPSGDHAGMQRMAGAVFMVRVASAVVVYASQVIMARWMGGHEFGIYVYVWTWMLLLGEFVDLGLGTAAQRFVPQYTGTQAFAHLRGFLSGSRWISVAAAFGVAALGVLAIAAFDTLIADHDMLPLYLACLALPLYALGAVQEGIARAYNWALLAMVPGYIARPLILLATMLILFAAGFPANATTALIAVVAAVSLAAAVQFILMQHRLSASVPAGPKENNVKAWITTSLPMLLVTGFCLLLTSTDVIVLRFFRPPEEVGIYYAAAKTLSLVAFVYFAVAAASAHRFAECDVAGNRTRLAELLRAAIHWTFWPSLAATLVILVAGWPILRLFGQRFVEGYVLMCILSIGLLARAALGPVEQLFTMMGEQKPCICVYAGAFVFNLAACVLLIPTFGGLGAAMATSSALIVQSILLFIVVKNRLGLRAFVWRGAAG